MKSFYTHKSFRHENPPPYGREKAAKDSWVSRGTMKGLRHLMNQVKAFYEDEATMRLLEPRSHRGDQGLEEKGSARCWTGPRRTSHPGIRHQAGSQQSRKTRTSPCGPETTPSTAYVLEMPQLHLLQGQDGTWKTPQALIPAEWGWRSAWESRTSRAYILKGPPVY